MGTQRWSITLELSPNPLMRWSTKFLRLGISEPLPYSLLTGYLESEFPQILSPDNLTVSTFWSFQSTKDGMEFRQNKPLSVCACVYIIKTVMRIHFYKMDYKCVYNTEHKGVPVSPSCRFSLLPFSPFCLSPCGLPCGISKLGEGQLWVFTHNFS